MAEKIPEEARLTRKEIDKTWGISLPENPTLERLIEDIYQKIERICEDQLLKAIPIIEKQMLSQNGIKVCMDSIIKRERKLAYEKVFGEIEKRIDNLTERKKALELQRQPLIEAMDDRQWTQEEQEFMYNSVHEIVETPNRIALLSNLKQVLKTKLGKGSK